MKDNLRLCLSLYACEPNRGSEPGVGWAWALGMAKRHETWVITRANNRAVIEEELDRLSISAEERPHFVWVDLPGWVCRLKKKGIVPVGLYYLLWQFAARRAWDRTGIRADVIHHVTFNTFTIPGVWWHRREKVVLGPLGGMSICPVAFLRCFPVIPRIREVLRSFFIGLGAWSPFYHRSRSSASALFFTTDVLRKSLEDGRALSRTLLETAVPERLIRFTDGSSADVRSRRFVWAGSLEGRKAPDIAVLAFLDAFRDSSDPPVLEIVGSGPLEQRLRKLVSANKAERIIHFCGKEPQEILWKMFRSSLALVFTSVRDTSGNVALEALACGTPIICFDHQGVKEIGDSSCALTIQPRSYGEAIVDFATAMRRLANEPDLVDRLGAAGRKRVLEKFTWNRQFDAVDAVYAEIVSRGR